MRRQERERERALDKTDGGGVWFRGNVWERVKYRHGGIVQGEANMMRQWLGIPKTFLSVLPFSLYISCKSVRCIEKLLKIKTKLILIPFTSFVYIYIVQNVVGKIDKEILRIGFRIDPTFWFKKITKKVFTIG